MELENLEDCAANRIDNISDETLINESAKLEFLIQLLLHLRDEGHRTLVFSLSRKMLNIIQRILINKKFKIMRLDGLVTKLKERERRVNLFQEDKSYDVFLLTTQVGGVGLTLTGADRVVIYDPSWNPATDAQSVDRIYRIGQKKSVVVYRLITCGSVEEKIYRRQIFKNSVIEQSTCGKKDPYRYFSRQDLAELFILDDVKTSTTQQQLQKLHSSQRKSEQSLVEHVEYLHTLKMFGLSDHDLMFSKKPDDFDYERDMAGGDFNNKVQEAQNRLRMESHQFTGYNEAELRWGAISVDNRGKDSTTKTNRNEPVYPIDGLSQKMNDLQLPEQFGSSFENSTSSSTENANSQSTLSSSDTETEKSDENDDDDNNIENSDSVNRDRLNSFFEANDKTRSHSPHSELQTTLPSTFQSHNKSQTSHKPNSSFFSNESLHDQQSTSNEHTSTPGQMNRKRLPSFDSDDDIILAVDTPDQEKSHFYTDQVSSMINENKLSSDDELILAVDSPLFQGKLKPTIQVTNTGTNDEVPTEIEDSLTIFSNSGSDVEGELNDSWKKAFSLHSSVALTPSQQDSPLIPPINRRRQVIESEGSDDEEKNYLQLNNGDSFADESKSSFNRKSHGLNSFNRTSMSNLSTLSLRISTSDREYDGADDVTEPYASNLNSSINDMKDASGRFTSQNTDKNSSNFNLCLSDFQDDDF